MKTAVTHTLVVAALFCLLGCGRVSAWKTKATFNERVASTRVGGFNDSDKQLYLTGIEHVRNAHQNIGSLTIGEVIDQERNRENVRANMQDHANTVAAKQQTQHLDAESTEGLRSVLKLANSVGPRIYKGGIIEDGRCAVEIDDDQVETSQDKSLIDETVVKACGGAYTELGKESRALPDDGLGVRIFDLAGNDIYNDIIKATNTK